MSSSRFITYLLIAILLAVGLDLLLSRWLRRSYRRRGQEAVPDERVVNLMGVYSPILTWLRRHLPSPALLLTWVKGLPGKFRSARHAFVSSQVLINKEESSQEETSRVGLKWRIIWILLEWVLIFLVILSFSGRFLSSGAGLELSGAESEIFQSLDWVLVNSLKYHHQFPLWNPYLHTGLPFIADPMTHIFNPLVTIPVLLLGVWKGFKIGLLLSLLAAALGMWWLGKILGMGAPVRIWMALMYALAGQPIGRFLHGQYLFILGFAWIPWIVGFLFLVYRTHRRSAMVGTAVSLALLFFSGNAYYSLYMLFLVGIFILVMIFGWQRQKPFLKINLKLFLSLIIIGVLALGLVAVQLIPTIEFWPHINKGMDLTGSQTLAEILQDFTSKQDYRPDAYPGTPANEEYYAYMGWMPLLALAFLTIAIWKRERKPILFFCLLLLFVVLWITVERLPWHEAFLKTRFFLQFRHLLRILVYGSFAIFALAGLGLDSLVRLFWSAISLQTSNFWIKARSYLMILGIGMVSVWMVMGVSDLSRTNQRITGLQQVNQTGYEAMRWLRQYDLSTYYVRFNPNNSMHDAVLSSNLYFMDAWYHFLDIRKFDGMLNRRNVQGRPNYVVQTVAEPAPETPAEIIYQIKDINVFYLAESLPYAFSVKNIELQKGSEAGELKHSDVLPLTPYVDGPNQLEIITSGQPDDLLVVMITNYPGWKAIVDGKPLLMQNVGGYLAVDMLPGVHKYVFSFQPRSVYIGLIISLLFVGLSGYLLFSDLRINLREALARFWDNLPRWWSVLPHPESKLPEILRRLRSLLDSLSSAGKFELILFILALTIYAITRLWALDRFPVYFFADEAVQTLYGQNLIAQHFHDAKGMLFPIYVEAAGFRWTPLLPMYLQALTLTLFGKSIAVTRATSAVVSILGALAAGLTLKSVFKARYSWAVILLLTITPAWFLHSRTAFETVMTTAFYACFLLCYLLYRTKSPRYLYSAVLFGAATFYTYSNAQLIIITAAILLLVSDLPYHLKNWRTLLPGALLTGILAWPLINFRLSQPKAISEHLRAIDSYWFHAIPIQEKLATFIQKYTFGLSPAYWFFPHELDLPRHRWDHLGHISLIVLPLVLVGLLVCLWRIRRVEYRSIILAGLAVPVGAALAGIGITRVLAFVVPANLLAAVGLEWLLERLKKWIPPPISALVIFIALAGTSFAMLRSALVNSPVWFKDYGLYGMQYGAKQLFVDAIPQVLEQDPQAQILVTSTWANGADEFIRFFLTSEQQKRVHMESVDSYLFKKLPLDPYKVFIMTASEYEKAAGSPKFKSVKVEHLIPYPDGTPGFYFVRMEYANNADEIFAAEKEARRKLLVANLQLWGQPVELHYSQIDMGSPELMFDGDHFTLMRGLEANPFILEFTFSQPRPVTGLEADLGLVDIQVTVMLYTDPSGQPVVYTQKRPNQGDPILKMIFDNPPGQVSKVRIELLNYLTGEVANIHIVELKLMP